MALIDVNAEEWPLVRVALPPDVSDDDVLAYLAELRALRQRRQRYAIVVDLRRTNGFSARQRRMQAEYMRDGLSLSRRDLLGLAFVTESALKRGALRAVFWLQPPPAPHELFGSLAEATHWARERLSEAKATVSLPPHS